MIPACPTCVQFPNTSCHGRVTELLLQPHSSRRSAARCQSGIWTPHDGEGSTLGSKPRNVLCLDIHPYRRNLPAWLRRTGSRVRETGARVRETGARVGRLARGFGRLAPGFRRLGTVFGRFKFAFRETRSRVPVHCFVSTEPNRQSMGGSKLGSEASVQSFVSRKQTPEARPRLAMAFRSPPTPRALSRMTWVHIDGCRGDGHGTQKPVYRGRVAALRRLLPAVRSLGGGFRGLADG